MATLSYAKLKTLTDPLICQNAMIAFSEAIASVKKLQKRLLSTNLNKLDREDSASGAILAGWRFIRRKSGDKKVQGWSKEDWYKHIMRRFQNAILEHAKYVYFPLVLPRPVRFSLKKYSDVLKIINKYVKSPFDITGSDLYRILCKEGCIATHKCEICELNYEKCPLYEVSTPDRKKLHDLLRGTRKSLEFYGKWYRKEYKEWLEILENVKMFSALHEVPEIPINYDYDSVLDLNRVKIRLNAINPNLYDIYCTSLADLDLEFLRLTNIIETPRGWNSKSVKDKYKLSTTQYKILLHVGDKVLNDFRADAGLPRIFRTIQEKSLSKETFEEDLGMAKKWPSQKTLITTG